MYKSYYTYYMCFYSNYNNIKKGLKIASRRCFYVKPRANASAVIKGY